MERRAFIGVIAGGLLGACRRNERELRPDGTSGGLRDRGSAPSRFEPMAALRFTHRQAHARHANAARPCWPSATV